MLKVEIFADPLVIKDGISEKTGKPYHIESQVAYLTKPGDKYPLKFLITLNKNQKKYTPGVYVLSPESIYVDRFGSLAVFPDLQVPASKSAVA